MGSDGRQPVSDSRRAPRRSLAQFFSTGDSFHEPVGSQIVPGSPRGYYVDLTVKAIQPRWSERWPPLGTFPWVAVCQTGLGSFERHLKGEGEEWLAFACDVGERLLGALTTDGHLDGGLVHSFDFPHTFPLGAPWLSAMAQGQAASLFVRLHGATGDERYGDAALRALRPMSVPSADGGVAASLDGGLWPEEYPTDPPSFVLNGGIFALWGLYDVATGLGDGDARGAWEEGIETLARNVERWDTGGWSRYDLFPHPVTNVASLAYHALHIAQLRATELIAPRHELSATAERFQRYSDSRLRIAGAFARKALFRVVVPRDERVARRWARGSR